jgi:hypothetical protein
MSEVNSRTEDRRQRAEDRGRRIEDTNEKGRPFGAALLDTSCLSLLEK